MSDIVTGGLQSGDEITQGLSHLTSSTPTPSGGAYPVYIWLDVADIETPLTFKQNDMGQQLVQMLRHISGSPIDLTGKVVTIRVWPIAGGDLKIEETATIECAKYGIVAYTFQEGDTDTPGSYNMEFSVANADESVGILTYPSSDYLRLRILASP